MCRWIAYTGPALGLDELLVKPSRSLLSQSRHARESTFEINADGFGVGWYAPGVETPGVYHETRPAWNDENLRSIASHLSSPMFLAHIRAATSVISRSNCHPFRRGRWLFQHNGVIGGFDRLRHELECRLDPAIHAQQEGSTDSEVMFGLCLTEGLAEDPPGAIGRMIEHVESARGQLRVEDPFKMTVAVADGQTLWAARHGSDGVGPSLYHTASHAALEEALGRAGVVESAATIVVSEPLDEVGEHWVDVPSGSWLRASGLDIEVGAI